MYKDSYGNISLANEITCPYCNEEFMDSREYIPRGGYGGTRGDKDRILKIINEVTPDVDITVVQWSRR